jgi:D-alanine-D-alanine ligase
MSKKQLLVGLTYDLRDDYLAEGFGLEETAEFDKAETIDSIEAAVRACGCRAERVGHARQLVRALAEGRRWDLVFNIAEGLYGTAREALVPALLDAYRVPYTFSPPDVLVVALDKALTKTVVSAAGVPTAPFQVVHEAADLDRVALPYPLFLKPVAEGTGKGISARSRVANAAELRALGTELLERFRQPVLVETYLPGREFTVGVGGSGDSAEVLGTIEVVFRNAGERIYSFATKADYKRLVSYVPVDDPTARRAAKVSLAAWRALRGLDAGRVDVRCDAAGEPCFVEVNPLAGLHPVDSDLPILCRHNGIEYNDLIGRILRSAAARYGLPLAG